MSEENKQLVRRYVDEVWNAHDPSRVGDFFADDELVERIRTGCATYLDAMPDLHVSIDELLAESDKVVLRTTNTGTHDGELKGIAPTGRNIVIESVEIFRIANGKFAGYWCLADVAALMRQLTEERAPAAAAAGGAS